MPYGLGGTDMQLRRPDMENMLEENKRDPRSVRRPGCVTCLTLVVVCVLLIVGSVVFSVL